MAPTTTARPCVHTTIELPPTAAGLRPLCPRCAATRVELSTRVGVVFDVVGGADTATELEVVAQRLDDADWGEDARVRCPACDWRGTVAALTPA